MVRLPLVVPTLVGVCGFAVPTCEHQLRSAVESGTLGPQIGKRPEQDIDHGLDLVEIDLDC